MTESKIGGRRPGAGRPKTVGEWSHLKVGKTTKTRIQGWAADLGLTHDQLLILALDALSERKEAK